MDNFGHQGLARAERAGYKDVTTMSLKRKIFWFCCGSVSILLTLLAFAPAAWLDMALQAQTGGRIALGDVQGSLWNGSAFVGVAADQDGELTPLLPGRFEWHLSPILLLGQIELELDNGAALQGPVHIRGNLRSLQLAPGSLMLPSERLAGLGAPLNTVRPSGRITLTWDELTLTWPEKNPEVSGTMKLTMQDIASALSPIRPLGSYLMTFVWHGQLAEIDLKTLQGPMLLSGKGALKQGRLQFSGQARAQEGQEDRLANLLNLLGQRKPGADENVIALEFN